MIVALLAVAYRTAQEMGLVLKDVVLFPFLVLLAWVLFLYWILASPRARRFYGRAYNRRASGRRLMTYLIVISIGAAVGGASAGVWWKLFEMHRQQMQKLRAAEGQTETTPAQTSNTAPTSSPASTEQPAPDLVGQIDSILPLESDPDPKTLKYVKPPGAKTMPRRPGARERNKLILQNNAHLYVIGSIKNRGQVASIADGWAITWKGVDDHTVEGVLMPVQENSEIRVDMSPDPKSQNWVTLRGKDYWPRKMDMNAIPANGVSYGFLYVRFPKLSLDELRVGGFMTLRFVDIRGKESTASIYIGSSPPTTKP